MTACTYPNHTRLWRYKGQEQWTCEACSPCAYPERAERWEQVALPPRALPSSPVPALLLGSPFVEWRKP